MGKVTSSLNMAEVKGKHRSVLAALPYLEDLETFKRNLAQALGNTL
jgi:hypothetical protein